jgi:hypothetical protein
MILYPVQIFALKIWRWKIDYSRKSGKYDRHGWSVCVDGSFYSQMEPWLAVAIWKAIRMSWLVWRDQTR